MANAPEMPNSSHTVTANTRHGIMVMAIIAMPVMAIIALVPVLPMLLREFANVPGHQFLVPFALTVPALCVALFSPVAGWLSDRLGRKNLLIGALLLYAAFGIVPWYLHDLYHIIAARIALGLVEAVIATIATTLIGAYFDGEKREKWIAIQSAVSGLSAIVLIAIAGGLGELLGTRGPFLLYLLAIPAAIAASLILFEPTVSRDARNESIAGFPYKAVMPLIGTTLFMGVVFYTIIVQLGPILQISGDVSPGVIGMIGALSNCAVGIGTFIFHKTSANLGARLLAVGLGIAAIGYGGASVSTTLPLIAGFVILAAVGCGILLPNMMAWTMRTLPPQMRGRGMGLWTGAFFLGQFIAPLIVAAVTSVTGSLAMAISAYAVAILVAALAAMIVARREPSAAMA